jgi:CheY-like chemotaxis protein
VRVQQNFLSGEKVKFLQIMRREEMGKILILDEHSSVRELTSAELASEGHLVVPIGKPCLIREVMNSLEPDLLLLDIHLSGVDRWDVLDALKKEVPHLPVLIFSAYEGDSKDPRMALADGFVVKSVCFEKLKAKVAEVLKRKTIHNAEGEKDTVINAQVSIPEAIPNAAIIHWRKNKTLHA